ncbi:lysophospholipid acyltransferase family protein [Amycolatopsis magusensis]
MLRRRSLRWTPLETGRGPFTLRQLWAVTRRFPRRGRGFFYSLAIDVIWPMLVFGTRPSFRGTEHLPASGGFVVASNHLSYADPTTLTAFCLSAGRVPRYLARADLWRLPLVGSIMSGGGHIPVHRGKPTASGAYRDAVGAVRRGECVAIFPEGGFSKDPDHWPVRGKTGIARIALETGVPVVPVANWGTHELLPQGSPLPRFFRRPRVQLVAGPPVELSDLVGAEPTAAVLREATDRIMTAVTTLLGEVRGQTPRVTR